MTSFKYRLVRFFFSTYKDQGELIESLLECQLLEIGVKKYYCTDGGLEGRNNDK